MLVFSAIITGTSLPPAQESLIQRVVLRPLGVPQHVEYVPGDLLDGSSGVHHGEQSPSLIVLLEGRTLAALERAGIQVLPRLGRGIVHQMVDPARRPAVHPSVQYPFDQLLVGGTFERDDPAQAPGPALLELGVQRPGLRRTGREVVENPAARPPYSGQDQRQHYLVRDRLAPVVAIPHPTPELRASLYVGPDELPTREPEVVVGKGLCESLGLGGLADPRGTDERYPHRFLVSSRMSNAGWLKSKGPRPGASALLARYR